MVFTLAPELLAVPPVERSTHLPHVDRACAVVIPDHLGAEGRAVVEQRLYALRSAGWSPSTFTLPPDPSSLGDLVAAVASSSCSDAEVWAGDPELVLPVVEAFWHRSLVTSLVLDPTVLDAAVTRLVASGPARDGVRTARRLLEAGAYADEVLVAHALDVHWLASAPPPFGSLHFASTSAVTPAPGRPRLAADPELTVLVSTYDRPDALEACLQALEVQTLPSSAFRVLVVDDASPRPVADVVARHTGRLDVRLLELSENLGPGGARTRGVSEVDTPLTLLMDDDDLPEPRCLEGHLLAHQENPGEEVAVLGGTSVLPAGTMTPLSRHVMTVGRQYFAYPGVQAGEMNPWRAFWCGRSSAKTSLLRRHGFTTRFMEDADFAFRAGKEGLTVHYAKRAVQVVRERLDLHHFHRRQNRIGHAMIDLARRCQDEEVWTWAGIEPVSDNLARWIQQRGEVQEVLDRLTDLPVDLLRARSHGDGDLLGLFDAALFIDLDAHYAAGLLAALRRRQAHVQDRRTVFGMRHDDPASLDCLTGLVGQAWAGAVVLAPSPQEAETFGGLAAQHLGPDVDAVDVEVRVTTAPLHAQRDVDLVLPGSLPPRWRTGMSVPLIGQPVPAWIDQLRDAVTTGPRGALR